MFSDFDRYLTSTYSDDYWSDEGIGIAVEKLARFTTEDWIRLNNEIVHRKSNWLIRCAETLGDVEEISAVDLLLKLLNKDDVEIQIAALDSINSLCDVSLVNEDVARKLREIVNNFVSSSVVVNSMLDSLRAKLYN